MKTSSLSESLLTAALEGLELQRQRIDEQITFVRSKLGSPAGTKDRQSAEKPKHTLSAAGRKAIAEAARKRWAQFHKQQNKTAK